MYEPRRQRPIPRRHFVRRVALHLAFAGAVISVSVAIGMTGYCYFEDLPWRDAFLNAAMLLGGMGPVNAPQTPGGKVFAGVFALYAGLVFLVSIALVLAPVVHRIMHRFHWDEK